VCVVVPTILIRKAASGEANVCFPGHRFLGFLLFNTFDLKGTSQEQCRFCLLLQATGRSLADATKNANTKANKY